MVFKQTDKRETISNLDKWLFFNLANTTNLFSNKKLVKHICSSKETKGILSNSDELNIHQETNIIRLGSILFSKNSITNLVSKTVLIYQGVWV